MDFYGSLPLFRGPPTALCRHSDDSWAEEGRDQTLAGLVMHSVDAVTDSHLVNKKPSRVLSGRQRTGQFRNNISRKHCRTTIKPGGKACM